MANHPNRSQRKLLWSADTAFGGVEYRARQNGSDVLLQSRTTTGNWQTVDRVTVAEWHQRAVDHDIDNPAFVAHFIDDLADSQA